MEDRSSISTIYRTTSTRGRTILVKALSVHPVAITAGPDGAMWIMGDARAERVTVDGKGTVFPLLQPSALYSAFTSGHDGALYFVDSTYLERMTTSGVATHVRWFGGAPNGAPDGVAVAADGSLWVALAAGQAIARVRVT